MKFIALVAILLVIGLLLWRQVGNAADIPKPGQVAPSFSLPDQNDKLHSLADYRG